MTGHSSPPPPDPTHSDSRFTSLDRLDSVLAARSGLRLRFACPSQEFSNAEMAFGTCRWLSCSRGIWESLALGAESDLALVMLQAPPVGDGVLDYLFSLLPPRMREHRSRHALVEIDDAGETHLSEKVLSDEHLLVRLRATAELARKHGHRVEGLSCYATSTRMAELADVLGIDLIDAAPALLAWGTKSGSRQVFRAAGVQHPVGSYRPDRTASGLAATLNDMTTRFGHGQWMLKADCGFGSGHGNVIIDTRDQPAPVGEYLDWIGPAGAIVEQVVTGGPNSTLRHPSALGYLRLTPDGRVSASLLCVHDQLLGPSGDFLGCRFPASPVYRAQVARAAEGILRQLASRGVTGHAGIDFIALVASAGPSLNALYATEINLRQTGTTHPHRLVRALLPETWQNVCYTGTDSIISARYRGISSDALIHRLRESPQVAFSPPTGYGAIPHLWPALQRCGKIGATFVAPSARGCEELERDFRSLLDDLAG